MSELHVSQGGKRHFGGPHGYGHRRDPVGHRRVSFKHSKFFGLSIYPNSIDLQKYGPDILDQNFTSGCTGHGESAAIYTVMGAAGTPLEWVPSPKGIYTLGRCMDRKPDFSGNLPKLTDDGVTPNQLERAISEYGVYAMRGPTSQGYNSDCEPANINDEPRFGDILEESKNIFLGKYEIDSFGNNRILDVKKSLASKIAVPFATQVDAAMEAYSSNSLPLDFINLVASLGGHYIYIDGYYTLSNGNTIFLGQNSWGKSWGKSGRFECTENFVKQMDSLYAMSIKKAA